MSTISDRILGSLLAATALSTALTAVPAQADQAATPTAPAPSLEDQFRDPPNSARPRVWWHWMNGNITKDGIAKDMAWMKSVGIGGLQNFDVNMMTPQIVEHRLVYMSPEWKDAFRFAASEAERLGLELAIASSPGWSETGRPWVPPADGLKKLVWSETIVAGGRRFSGKLAPPPAVTGPFQSLKAGPDVSEMMSGGGGEPKPQANGDIAVLAVLAVPVYLAVPAMPHVSLGSGGALDATSLFDGDPNTGLSVPHGTAAAPTGVVLAYDQPQTMRSLAFYVSGARMMFGGAAERAGAGIQR